MHCTACKYPSSRVVETNPNDLKDRIVRRRECLRCGSRFTTYEQIRPSKIKPENQGRK